MAEENKTEIKPFVFGADATSQGGFVFAPMSTLQLLLRVLN